MFFLVPGSTASIVMFPMDLVKRQMQMVGLLCSMSLVLVQWWKIVKLIQRETSVKSKNGCLGGTITTVNPYEPTNIMGRIGFFFPFFLLNLTKLTEMDSP